MTTLRKKSLFLTGGAGYLGRRLIECLPPGYARPVFALVRNRVQMAGAGSRVRLICGDLLEPATYAGALSECDTVVHLAAATGKNRPEVYFRDNVEGTRRLLIAAKQAGIRNFLHVSTIAANFPDLSRYYYAQSKKEAERLVAASGLAYLILRPTIIIGKNAPVLQSLARLAASPVTPVFGNGRVKVQPIFVDDLAGSILTALEENYFPNAAVDLGGPQVLSMNELMTRLRRCCRPGRARLFHLPLSLVGPVVAALERICFPLVPFTSGQLASFSHAGVAAETPFLLSRMADMKTVDQVLAGLN